MSKLYWVMKTGFEMLDVYHVYGVAHLLSTAAARASPRVRGDVVIEDVGPLWTVQAPDIPLDDALAREVSQYVTAALVRDDSTGEGNDEGARPPEWFLRRGWTYIHATLREGREQRAAQLTERLPPAIMAMRPGVVLPKGYPPDTAKFLQGLETAAGKGSRRPARAAYSEEGLDAGHLPQAMADVACVGLMAVGHIEWPRGGHPSISMVGVPQRVIFTNHIAVRDALRTGGPLSDASDLSAVAHYAVRLVQSLARHSASASPRASRYSGITYETMVGTGANSKPSHGGVFPLDFLNHLATSADSADGSGDLLDVWDAVFVAAAPKGGKDKGKESVALSLAEFLGHPTLRTLERHWRYHLRANLRDRGDRKQIGKLYPEPAMKGLMAHVEA